MTLEPVSESKNWWRGKWSLWGSLVLLALGCRTLCVFWNVTTLAADPDAYGALAQCWATTGTFGLVDEHGTPAPTAFRPPLYPWLLSWTVLDGTLTLTLVGAIHVGLGVATCLLTFSILKRHFVSERFAFAAALLVVVDPILLHQSTLLMSETLATFLAILCLNLLSQWHKTFDEQQTYSMVWQPWLWVVAFALLLGCQSLCRPTGLVWSWLILLGILPGLGIQRAWNRGWWALCIGSLLFTGMWALRNRQQLHAPILMTSHGGYTLLLANNPEIYDHFRHHSVSRHWNALAFHQDWERSLRDVNGQVIDEVQADKLATDRAMRTIANDQAMFLWSCLVRIGWLWAWWPAGDHQDHETETPAPNSRSLGKGTAIGVWYACWEVLALVGVIAWMAGASRVSRLDPVVLAAFLLPLSLTLVHAVYWSNMRMRAPAMPVVYGFAMLFLDRMASSSRFMEASPARKKQRMQGAASIPLTSLSPLAIVLGILSPMMGIAQEWQALPDLPNTQGVAGPFVGTHDGILLVAGGANFPERPPWDGGKKVWHDEVFAWKPGQSAWRIVGRLPLASAYGLSISTPEGMICIGGSTSDQHLRTCFRMRVTDQQLVIESLPDLPISVANGCGAMVDGVVYLAGGQESPDAKSALSTFFSLDLLHLDQGWVQQATWPGPPRILGLASVFRDQFLLMSGADLELTEGESIRRRYLRDAYAFRADQGWVRLPDLPYSVAAAPSPALQIDANALLVLGGDDGTLIGTDPKSHPGFAKRLLKYHVAERRWEELASPPFARVTTQTTVLNDQWIIPSGETRPGVRSPQVFSLPLPGNR